jgi:hypothetical protein
MVNLCQDITRRCAEYSHIHVPSCLFTVTASRSRKQRGLLARVTPMRFRQGARFQHRRGITYEIQRYHHNDREILYIVTFCMPRFLNLPFEEKLTTVFHELYHMSPHFDGDVRRLEGRYSIHSRSKAEYDRIMLQHVKRYLAGEHDARGLEFLYSTASQLAIRHGSILGIRVPRPLAIPIHSTRLS